MATGEIGRIFLVLSGRLISVGSAVAVLALACGGANAQDRYPSKPVRMVVSFSAGGPTDTVARVMSARMAELLGQQFVVENRVGAGGNIGADMVAKSPPDGYTLLMATVSTHAINPGLYKKMPYDPVRDFAPLGRVGVTPTLLGVHPSVPATDIKSRSPWSRRTRANTPTARPGWARSFISAANSSRRRPAASTSCMCRIAARRR